MKIFKQLCLLIVGGICCMSAGFAQAVTGLFESDSVLEISLSGDVKRLFNNRYDELKYHPLVLSYHTTDGSVDSIPIRAKTRGNFRRLKGNCTYPPIWINFKSDVQNRSIFYQQDKMKVVMPCASDDYVVYEWLAYKLYNLVSPNSFRGRLAKLTLHQAGKKKPSDAFYCILLEEEDQMAKRNRKITIETKIKPQQTDTANFLKMAVFEYMIGNTDWSVDYLQNVKLLAKDSLAVPIPVAYDFDHSGIVYAPYAKPTEQLHLSSVRERRYRGYCIEDMKAFDTTIAFFNSIKKNIYSIYTGCNLLDEKYIRSTVKFLDDFYEIINNPGKLKKEFSYPCDEYGTGNVIIKGLQTD